MNCTMHNTWHKKQIIKLYWMTKKWSLKIEKIKRKVLKILNLRETLKIMNLLIWISNK